MNDGKEFINCEELLPDKKNYIWVGKIFKALVFGEIWSLFGSLDVDVFIPWRNRFQFSFVVEARKWSRVLLVRVEGQLFERVQLLDPDPSPKESVYY